VGPEAMYWNKNRRTEERETLEMTAEKQEVNPPPLSPVIGT